MASYKSQFALPRRTEGRAPATRLPQPALAPHTIAPQLSAGSKSKLQKRRPSHDEQTHSKTPAFQALPVRVSSRQGSTAYPVTMNQPSKILTFVPSTQASTARRPKLDVPFSTSTPSLASGSSASTIESPRSHVLRRKQTSVAVTGDRQVLRIRDDSLSSQDDSLLTDGIPDGYKDPFTDTVLGISMPPSSTTLAHSEPGVDDFTNSLYDCDIGPTDVLPLPLPQYALSATPSTLCSESPGAFSISSTPTSMSSYSPGVTLPKTSIRTRQMSPLQSRPPTMRHRTPDESHIRHPHTLSTVHESSTSSSSASTVVTDGARHKGKVMHDGLGLLLHSPPVPPLAQSSVNPTPSQAPPEFAHLADFSFPSFLTTRRPSRPSRDGTPEIVGLQGPSPVIQSNMTNFPSSHRQTSSAEIKSGLMSTSRPKLPALPQSSSRIPSPHAPSAAPSNARTPARGPTPDMQKAGTLPTPTSAPSPGKNSRFGFFTRRTKTESVASVVKSENKTQRRGPAAGTGHEGYGKHAGRGRSGSTASATSLRRSMSAGTTAESLDQTPSTRKSSMTSTTSTDVDDFLRNRLAPVVIRGTGNSSELPRSPEPAHSKSSLDISPVQAPDSQKTNGNVPQPTVDHNRPVLLPSAMPNTLRGASPKKKMTLGLRRPSESDDDSRKTFLLSRAPRRTSRTLLASQASTHPAAAPVNQVADKRRKDSMNDAVVEGKEGTWLKPLKKGKAEKEAKPTKRWNFFQRAHAAPRVMAPTGPFVAAGALSQTHGSRSVAHYTLNNQSGLDLNDIEQLMEASTADEGAESALSDDDDSGRRERMQSMLLPPKPLLPANYAFPARSASPKVFLRPGAQTEQRREELMIDTNVSQPSLRQSLAELTPFTDLSPNSSPTRATAAEVPVTATLGFSSIPAPVHVPVHFPIPSRSLPPPGPPPTSPPPRPSRLPQVGRIPQVVSTRRQPRRPSAQSFSRPFAADQPRPMALFRTSLDSASSVFATSRPAEPYPILHGLNALSQGSAIATVHPPFDGAHRRSEFFEFPPRKDSEVSYSSSSGVCSFAPAASTAVIPAPGAPLLEDELWDEYDDWIDDVLSPVAPCANEETLDVRDQHASLDLSPWRTTKSPKLLQPDQEISHPSVHLRRSRLLAVLHSAQSPTSTTSFSDFLSELGERKFSVVDPVTGRLSLPVSTRLSTGSIAKRSTRSSLPASLPRSTRQSRSTVASKSSQDCDNGSTNRYGDTRLMEVAESQADGRLSMANLRFGALMTSKWLSFGRVLFSPVHFEVKDPIEDRVLVVDGLGKDWSYYCALTYPEATIFDIGPDLSSTSTPAKDSSEPWSTLQNHRHIHHPTLSNAFPFPMNFFACVVLRFPTALPSATHRFVLSEAKRVLRPGGYLEFSVLDMDLVNMGNRARRAVRELKMKMQAVDESISLRNISDEIMAGIGRKGFIGCNRCVLGVPVAGKLPSTDERRAMSITKSTSNTTSPTSHSGTSTLDCSEIKQNMSFPNLWNVSSPSDSTDNGITDMMARVGRWWYSRCYESLILPDVDQPDSTTPNNFLDNSIWRDKSLVNECEKRGTTFKLLIGYAQKPEVGVRRTVSV